MLSLRSQACPQFEGHFQDEEKVLIVFTQVGCDKIVMSSNGEETQLILDGQSRLHQSGSTQDAFISAKFDGEALKIENVIRLKDQTGDAFKHKMLMGYHFESADVLIETTELLDASGSTVDKKSAKLSRVQKRD